MFMIRRRYAARRAAAWLIVTALLLQSLVGSAATLRMWAAGHDPLLLAAGICVGQPPNPASGGQDQGPGRATHDHQQCLLCNAGLAPGTLPVVALLPPPPEGVAELLPVPQQTAIGKDVRACPPRGPPVLA